MGKSDPSILNIEAFVNQVKGQRIPEGYKMIFERTLERGD